MNYIYKMLIVTCVILACFACSDDNNDEYSYNSLEGKELVNGTVIDSVPMAGTVAVIGKKTSNDDQFIKHIRIYDNNGSYRVNVADLEPPLILRADGYIASQRKTYYSYLDESKLAEVKNTDIPVNITEFSTLAVEQAFQDDGVNSALLFVNGASELPSYNEITVKDAANALLKEFNTNAQPIDPFYDPISTESDLGHLLQLVDVTNLTIRGNLASNPVLYTANVVTPEAEAYFQGNQNALDNIKRLTILQTSDLHNHVSGYGPFNDYTPLDTTDNDMVKGGYARLAAKMLEIKMSLSIAGFPCLIIDSGDYFMGTIYDLTGQVSPVTLIIMQTIGYNAITLGNHEFDWAPDGLAMMLSNAIKEGFNVPVVATNLVTNPDDNRDDGIEQLIAQQKIVEKKVMSYTNGLTVGLLGVMGKQAALYSPMASPVTFRHKDGSFYGYIQDKVDELKNQDNCDIVIVMSHSDVTDDHDLIENVSGIDIIASGHTHDALSEPKDDSGTLIINPGRYGEHLCKLEILYNTKEKAIVGNTFELIAIDDSISGNSLIHSNIKLAEATLSSTISAMGMLPLTATVAKTSFPLELKPGQETGIGNLVSDANRAVANQLRVADQNPYYIGVAANGYIRDYIYPGKTEIVTFSDIYNVLPLGISPLATPGYPLMSVYLNAYEIRALCEVSAMVALGIDPKLVDDYFLNLSGIQYNINSSKPPGYMVDKVKFFDPGDSNCTDVVKMIQLEDIWPYNETPITIVQEGITPTVDPTSGANFYTNTTNIWIPNSQKQYRVAMNLYVLQMILQLATNDDYKNYAALVPKPKDKDGNIIDLKALVTPEGFKPYCIDFDPTTEKKDDLKEFVALWQFLSKFPQQDGTPIIPPNSPYDDRFIQQTNSRITKN